MSTFQEIEKTTGFERKPSESVSEYLSRLGRAAGVDEGELDAVREAVHTELYSPDPLPEEERERIRSFAETVSDRASAEAVERAAEAGSGGTTTNTAGVAGGRPTGGTGGRAGEAEGGSASADGAAGTLESLAGRWDAASGSTRRKFLAGVGVAGTVGVGAAAAGIGAIGGSGNDETYVAGQPSTTVGGAWDDDETESGVEAGTATDDAASEETSAPSGETDRTSLAAADVAIEGFDLRELERAEWPQRTPEVCRYPIDQLDEVPTLAYRDGESGVDPLESARRILGMLACYDETEETAFLEKATEMGAALYEAGETVDDAVYFPHGYDVNPHEEDWPIEAPWFSATTQGVALSAFARLHAYGRGETVYQYGQSVLQSFDSVLTRAEGDPPAEPWVACADGEYLWLEEYGRLPASHVLSGHGYAAWGLYESWAATGSELAAELFRASATTVRERAEAFRNEDAPSDYCLGHGVIDPSYHPIHVRQLRTFHRLTGDDAFEALAREFEADFQGT